MIYIVDTNVLLRFLLADDPIQSPIARSYFVNRENTLIIDTVVLCEAVWVMKKRSKLKNQKIVQILQGLTIEPHIKLDKEKFNQGIEFLQNGGDFANGIIFYQSSQFDNAKVLSFDKKAKKLAESVGIKLEIK